MLYCDLKPSNLLMDEGGRAKLGGFGLSRKLAPDGKPGAAQHVRPPLMRLLLFVVSIIWQAGHRATLPHTPQKVPRSLHSDVRQQHFLKIYVSGSIRQSCAVCDKHKALAKQLIKQMISSFDAVSSPARPGALHNSSEHSSTCLTCRQAQQGTPAYMAPELFGGGGAYSSASDLWALGCVLHECFVGRPPFACASLKQLMRDVLAKPAPALPGSAACPHPLQAMPQYSFSRLRGRQVHRASTRCACVRHDYAFDGSIFMRLSGARCAVPPMNALGIMHGDADGGGDGKAAVLLFNVWMCPT